MTRTRQPRGAAAKTKAAIKREAAADKASAYRRAVVAADADDVRAAKAGRPSILDELAAAPRSRPRWEFTDEQRQDIEQVFAAEDAGTIKCGCRKLAAIIKARYDLPWAVATIHNRLLDLRNSR